MSYFSGHSFDVILQPLAVPTDDGNDEGTSFVQVQAAIQGPMSHKLDEDDRSKAGDPFSAHLVLLNSIRMLNYMVNFRNSQQPS